MIRRMWEEFVIAVVACLVVVGLLLGLYENSRNQELYENQIESCERGRVIREVLHEFLQAAITARTTPPIEPGDLDAADAYRLQDQRIWPPRPCSEIIEKP